MQPQRENIYREFFVMVLKGFIFFADDHVLIYTLILNSNIFADRRTAKSNQRSREKNWGETITSGNNTSIRVWARWCRENLSYGTNTYVFVTMRSMLMSIHQIQKLLHLGGYPCRSLVMLRTVKRPHFHINALQMNQNTKHKFEQNSSHWDVLTLHGNMWLKRT